MKIDTTQLTIKDGDLIIFKLTEITPDQIMREYSHGINEFVRDNFPNNKHIFLDYRTDITVIKDENTRKHRPFKEKIKGKI